MIHLQEWEVVITIAFLFGAGYGLGYLRGKIVTTQRISKIIRGARLMFL